MTHTSYTLNNDVYGTTIRCSCGWMLINTANPSVAVEAWWAHSGFTPRDVEIPDLVDHVPSVVPKADAWPVGTVLRMTMPGRPVAAVKVSADEWRITSEVRTPSVDWDTLVDRVMKHALTVEIARAYETLEDWAT